MASGQCIKCAVAEPVDIAMEPVVQEPVEAEALAAKEVKEVKEAKEVKEVKGEAPAASLLPCGRRALCKRQAPAAERQAPATERQVEAPAVAPCLCGVMYNGMCINCNK